ncbi:hypothetical protein ACOMHN_023200 [Nucella lapillus]
MDVRRNLALAVANQFTKDGVVCPSNVKRGVFTTGAVDNIDESGRFEMHGTAISLTSHPSRANPGVDSRPLDFSDLENASMKLPDNYSNVPIIEEHAGQISFPPIPEGSATPGFLRDLSGDTTHQAWLSHVHEVLTENNGNPFGPPVTYSGFFSHSQRDEDVRPRATVGVFSTFLEKASSMSMQKHAMQVVMKATEFVNPGQIPVIVGDCPLYVQQKKCQMAYSDEQYISFEFEFEFSLNEPAHPSRDMTTDEATRNEAARAAPLVTNQAERGYGQPRQRENDNQHRESDNQHRESDNQLRENDNQHRENDNQHRESDNQHRESDNQHRESDNQHRESDNQHRESDNQHRESNNQLRENDNQHRESNNQLRENDNQHRESDN